MADPQPPARRRFALQLVPFVALAVLGALLVALLLQADHRNTRDAARRDAVQVARQEVSNLTTLSYRSADSYVTRVLALATGDLRRQFETQRREIAAGISGQRSTSRGSILAAGLVHLSGGLDEASVAVAADATVTQGSQSAVKHFRMLVQLTRVDGRWLVSSASDFAGQPK